MGASGNRVHGASQPLVMCQRLDRNPVCKKMHTLLVLRNAARVNINFTS